MAENECEMYIESIYGAYDSRWLQNLILETNMPHAWLLDENKVNNDSGCIKLIRCIALSKKECLLCYYFG